MQNLSAFYSTPAGRWAARAAVVVGGALIHSGLIPLDFVIPGLGLSVGQILPLLAPLVPSLK